MDYLRQLEIIDPDALNIPITIIGAGTIGSYTAFCLSKMGATDITVWDEDIIEEHNTPNQVYPDGDTGQKKVKALSWFLDHYGNQIFTEEKNWDGQVLDTKILISAVDSIETRKKLFETHKGLSTFFIDGRMGRDVLEMYPVLLSDGPSCDFYDKTLFPPEDAEEIPCSARSVAYNGFIMGGYIATLVKNHLIGDTLPRFLQFDLRNYLFDMEGR